jgi:hypothetical protein
MSSSFRKLHNIHQCGLNSCLIFSLQRNHPWKDNQVFLLRFWNSKFDFRIKDSLVWNLFWVTNTVDTWALNIDLINELNVRKGLRKCYIKGIDIVVLKAEHLGK